MKKLLVIGAVCAVSALGAYAMQVTTSCGITDETVTPDFFVDEDGDIDWEDATKYYFTELDEAVCKGY